MKWILPVLALFIGLLLGWWLPQALDAPASRSQQTDFRDGYVSKNATNAQTKGEATQDEKPELTKEESSLSSEYGVSQAWLDSLEELNELDQLSAILPRLQNARPEDFVILMDALQKYSGRMSGMARSILATKWASTNPQGMMAYIEQQPQSERWSLRSSLYASWAKLDPEAAFAASVQMTERRTQLSALQAVIQAVAEEDPRRAIEMAKQMNELGHRADWVLRNVYQSWASIEPESARESALALEDGPGKVQALSGAMQDWMSREPMAALEWLDTLPIDSTVYNSRKQVLRNLLNQDFETTKAYIEGKTNPMERRQVLENISFGNLAWKKDYQEVIEMYDWIGEVATGQVYDRKVSDLIRSMADIDRNQAMSFVLELPAGNARMSAIGTLSQKIAERDPAGAINFAMGLGYEDEKQRALNYMGWQLSRYGVDAVSQLVAESTDEVVQRELANRIASEWSKYDQAGALAWAETVTDPDARSNAIQSVYRNWIQSDPVAAMAYLETSVEPDKRDNYLRSGFQEWARQDPTQAILWLDRIPESIDEDRVDDMYRSVTQSYVKHDPLAASEWIATLEQGKNRDESVKALVQNIAKTDPEAGFIWSTTLGDDDARKDSLNRSMREWVKSDPDAAFSAVKDAKIAAAEKESLFEMIEKAR